MSGSASGWRAVETPVGEFRLWCAVDGSLRSGWFDEGDDAARPVESGGDEILLRRAERLVRAYLAGEPVDFTELPLPPGPAFHRRCWAAVRRVSPGSTLSYADLAIVAGSGRGAARAAGQAMRSNPIPVIVPCHRVIAADGRLGGFAGSTDPDGPFLVRKRFLLAHEGAAVPTRSPCRGAAMPFGS